MTINDLVIDVVGMPAAQGSKRHVGNGVMVESSKKVKPWRQDVAAATVAAIAKIADFEPFSSAVGVDVTFFLPRPRSHYRANGELKDTAPGFVATRPDIEKLVRSTHDALTTAGAWRDDALAAYTVARKVYANGSTGAHVRIFEMTRPVAVAALVVACGNCGNDDPALGLDWCSDCLKAMDAS